MRTVFYILFALMAALPAGAKSNDKPQNDLPKDPRALLAAAAPYYDFSSPDLKPWHLKATYQLFDENGKPTEQGTFEYWWTSPKVYRSTWTRAGASETIWHTADGKVWSLKNGERLRYYERYLPEMLFSPMSPKAMSNPKDMRLDSREVKVKKVKFPCVTLIPKPLNVDGHLLAPVGGSPTYCFDPNTPALRFTYQFGEVTTEYDRMAKMQNHYLPMLVRVASGRTMLFSAEVDHVDGIKPDDSALTPAKDAKVMEPVFWGAALNHTGGRLVQYTFPIYPLLAKSEGIQGTVLLSATIGTDGRVRNLQVVATPSPLLAKSAEDAVANWRYEPYLSDGKPVEVETLINVQFSLGR